MEEGLKTGDQRTPAEMILDLEALITEIDLKIVELGEGVKKSELEELMARKRIYTKELATLKGEPITDTSFFKRRI